jgi:uncharacterized protein YdeI (YjbR/CyaY-like superfamily)
MIGRDGAPILFFETPKAWEQWLKKHHSDTTAVWLRFYKKASGIASLTYDQALDEALCYGWIDGVVNAYDEQSYLQRFTPRRPKGNWSKRNTEHIARLIKLGKMRAAGLAAVEAAKKDGRWQAAYASPSNIKIPEDFLKEIAKNKKAKAFFDTVNRTNFYAIAYRLATAKKPETVEKRKKVILEMLEKGEKFH